MRRKFGSYTINVVNKNKKNNNDGTMTLTTTLTGNIEIGLEMDSHTWRGDWFLRLFFGDNYDKYSIVSIDNNNTWTNSPYYLEINTVTAVVRRRAA